MSTEQPSGPPQPPQEDEPAEPPEPALPDWFRKIPFDPKKGNYVEIVSDGLRAMRGPDGEDAAEVRRAGEDA